MITIKKKYAIEKMEQAGKRLFAIFDLLGNQVIEGVTTLQIDSFIEKELARAGLVSQTKGYRGYRHASCISINDELVHGVPSEKKVIRSGDTVKIDICASLDGYCADMARPFFVGMVKKEHVHSAHVAQQALDRGIARARAGAHLSDISAAIQEEIEKNGYAVVRDFAGHGIGKRMHEDPEILNYGKPGKGPLLRPGMTFAIEPMLTNGSYELTIMEDGWTAKTADGSFASHVEDTILITEHEPKILTRF